MTNQIYDNNGLKKHIVFTLMAKMKMKLKWFLPAFVYLFTGYCLAAETLYTLEPSYTPSASEIAAVFNVNGDTNQNTGGAVNITMDKSLPTYTFNYTQSRGWGNNGTTTFRWASSSPLFNASYSSNVDTSQIMTVNGKAYYRLKMTGNESFPVYIRLEQKVFFPGENLSRFLDLKDIDKQSLQNRGSFFFNTVFSNNTLSSCKNSRGNFEVFLYCNNNLQYTLSQQYGNRDVKMYFYMPKTPLYPITFNNINVGSLDASRICIAAVAGKWTAADENAAFEKANSCTLGSEKRPLTKYYLDGSLIFRNTCKVTETTKNVVLADITEAKLAGKAQGALPEGYAPKETKVSMKCSGNINDTFPDGAGTVQATMMGVGYSYDADLALKGILLAKGVGTTINNLGIKITQDAAGQSLVKLDGLSPLRATINNDMATVTFYSYPTPARAGVNPTGAGGYEASATLTFEIL